MATPVIPQLLLQTDFIADLLAAVVLWTNFPTPMEIQPVVCLKCEFGILLTLITLPSPATGPGNRTPQFQGKGVNNSRCLYFSEV